MNYMKLDMDDIIAWCQENDKVEWLKKIAAKKTPYKVYPRIKVDGKSVVDKSQEPKIEMRPISYIQIKQEIVDKFMPELKPAAKPKKKTFYEKIAEL